MSYVSTLVVKDFSNPLDIIRISSVIEDEKSSQHSSLPLSKILHASKENLVIIYASNDQCLHAQLKFPHQGLGDSTVVPITPVVKEIPIETTNTPLDDSLMALSLLNPYTLKR